MKAFTIGFIGFGLIGGSIARGLKRSDPAFRILAYMRTRSKLEQARRDRIVDEILDDVDERLSECDVILLCTPVEYISEYLQKIRPFLKEGAVVSDVGSTKSAIHETVRALGMESCFVGGHPMAGSEKSGYEYSTDHLLENAYYIITPTSEVPTESVDRIVEIAGHLGAIPLLINPQDHDRIVAAISHLPHLIAAALVNLVHDNDDEGQHMKRMAAGGFKDITRIASSSPVMWEQICMTNRGPIMEMLDLYMDSLAAIRKDLDNGTEGAVYDLFTKSRDYRNSFASTRKGSLTPSYSFFVDVKDEPGAIAIISSILAASAINIRNIGINNARDMDEYALREFLADDILSAKFAGDATDGSSPDGIVYGIDIRSRCDSVVSGGSVYETLGQNELDDIRERAENQIAGAQKSDHAAFAAAFEQFAGRFWDLAQIQDACGRCCLPLVGQYTSAWQPCLYPGICLCHLVGGFLHTA